MQIDFQMRKQSVLVYLQSFVLNLSTFTVFLVFLMSCGFLLTFLSTTHFFDFRANRVSRRVLLTQWPSSACLQRQREADETMSDTGKSTDMLSDWNDSCTNRASLLLISVWQEVLLDVFHCREGKLCHAWVSSKGPKCTLVKQRLHSGPVDMKEVYKTWRKLAVSIPVHAGTC